MSGNRRRYLRTILLGLAAMAVLLWAAIEQFDIPREEMLELFIATLLATGLVIALAAAVAGLWIGLRWLIRRARDD
ncbi:MAG: hypothetical protein U5K56_00895 [Halioglobus sp.]|nr:hypothetical protein [Halioglobus sp.]